MIFKIPTHCLNFIAMQLFRRTDGRFSPDASINGLVPPAPLGIFSEGNKAPGPVFPTESPHSLLPAWYALIQTTPRVAKIPRGAVEGSGKLSDGQNLGSLISISYFEIFFHDSAFVRDGGSA